MPKHSLGFYLQLAAIGVGGLKDRLTRDFEALIFKDRREYVDFVESMLMAMVRSLIGREEADLCRICEKFQECRGRGTREGRPKLYRAGVSDREILEKAGLGSIRCAEEISWCSAALSYVERVRSSGGPLGGTVSNIMLARTLVYGKLRDTMTEIRGEETQVDSLGIMLIGGLFSLISTIRVNRGLFELYLLPDGSPESLLLANTVYEAFLSGESRGRSFNRVLTDLMRLEVGLSIDLATYIASLTYLSLTMKSMAELSGLTAREGFEKFLLARVESSGMRPQLVWMGPLTVSRALIAIRGKESILEDLWYLSGISYQLSRRKSKEKQNAGKRLASTVAKCYSNLALYLWTEGRDLLFECSRDLSEIADDPRGLDEVAIQHVKGALGVIPAFVRRTQTL